MWGGAVKQNVTLKEQGPVILWLRDRYAPDHPTNQNQTEPTIQADQPEVKMVRMNVWKGQQQGSELSID